MTQESTQEDSSPSDSITPSCDEEEKIIVCRNLVKTYGEGNNKVQALRGLNLEINQGEFIAILGTSGSGKTTLLNLLGGLDSPTNGSIIFCGRDISTLSEKERALFRREVGFIYQDFNLHPVLTAAQNIELPLIYANQPKRERKERVKQLLEQVDLTNRTNHLPNELSSGEKQRVGIARALANHPKLILADQPTGNLDSEIGEEILELLLELHYQEQMTICLVTHNLLIAKKADVLYNIQDGLISEFSKELIEG
ncbi:MAG: ATP-binding cassette domain-containing protein [Candidatus Heimdallarchaeota archaeon]|nr:ATP-binding cassette domain-containing protein [Candidatus Heimdallarchaeota archaeon]